MSWEKIGGGSYKYDVYRHKDDPPKWNIYIFILMCLIFGFAAKGCNDALVGAEPSVQITNIFHGDDMLAGIILMPFALGAVARSMSSVMKGFCMAGIASGIMLCVFDWTTSIDGFNQLMAGNGNAREGFITTFLPMTFGTLALAFNACSSYFFALFLRNQGQFTDFSSAVTSILWFAFVLYDGVSSVIGILSTFSGVTISDFTGFAEASSILGPFGTVFGFLVSTLLALSPFITAMFGELLKEHSQ